MRNYETHRIGLALVALAWATPASAHHVDDFKTPATWLEGFISGVAHPVLEPDHLILIVAIALASAMVARGGQLVAVFVSALLVGVVAQVLHGGLPGLEILVAASTLLVGLALLARGWTDPRIWLAAAGLAGLIHGNALGAAIAPAAAGVIASYLLGLTTILLVLIVPIKLLASANMAQPWTRGRPLQAAGITVAAFGAVYLASALAAA